jgi:hypothetical protein
VIFKKILVALEQGRGGGPSLFEQALDLAAKGSSELMLLHCAAERTRAEFEERIGVVAELEPSQSSGDLDHLRQRELDHVRGWLEHWGADLIVLGRSRHSTLRDFLAGGVGVYVSHHAPCSVLAVGGKSSEER